MNDTREKIIIFEPDSGTGETLLSGFRETGYEASAFSTFAEALEAVRQSNADLLVLDFPALDPSAREMLATIRGASTTAGARVVLLVGPEAWQRTAALEYGADDALSRPWDSGELLARVRTQL